MIRFKRIFFMLSIMLVVFSNECIVHGESTPSAIIYNLRSTRGNTVTKTFTLSQDTQVQYSYTTDFEDDGYIIISGPNGQIHHRDRNIGNLYADSFPGLKGATYTVKVNGGEYYDDEDYEYDYGDVNLTIKYYELNTNTMMYDFKLSGPYSDDSNCSETYNLYLPTDSISTGCYGRSSSHDFNSISDIKPINYPIHVWWTLKMSNHEDYTGDNPVFKITLEDENGVQEIKKNVVGYTTSASGDFELPKNNKMLIYIYTGDTVTIDNEKVIHMISKK